MAPLVSVCAMLGSSCSVAASVNIDSYPLRTLTLVAEQLRSYIRTEKLKAFCWVINCHRRMTYFPSSRWCTNSRLIITTTMLFWRGLQLLSLLITSTPLQVLEAYLSTCLHFYFYFVTRRKLSPLQAETCSLH